MQFRRLYWVTEQFNDSGESAVTGVFTSLYDLIADGLRWLPEPANSTRFRLTLIKLDSTKEPLGVWASPDFGNVTEDLQQYVKTGEFSEGDVDALAGALSAHMDEAPGK